MSAAASKMDECIDAPVLPWLPDSGPRSFGSGIIPNCLRLLDTDNSEELRLCVTVAMPEAQK